MEPQIKADSYSQSLKAAFASNMLGMLDHVEEKSQNASDTLIAEFKKELDAKREEFINSVPVSSITINDADEVKLKLEKSPHLEQMILNAKLQMHTLLVGPAGCGKTTVAQQLGEALGLQFASVCLTAGASETWLFGRQTPSLGFIEGTFSKLYKEGGVFLADEMDAADPNLLLSINTALSHDELFNPMSGETIPRHKDFIFVAAANTNGKGATHMYTGRSRLDAATLDRFNTINVNYDKALERVLCQDDNFAKLLHQLRDDMTNDGCEEFISTRAFKKAGQYLAQKCDPRDTLHMLTAHFSGLTAECRDNAYDYWERNLNRSALSEIEENRREGNFFSVSGTVELKRKGRAGSRSIKRNASGRRKDKEPKIPF